jgi:DNA invertase Pin-like site-specific DNA recombinase
MKIGYGRVSKLDQNPALQIDALNAAGCEKLFIEKISSGKQERPQWLAANAYLRRGDTLVVWKLDRLARSTLELAQVAADFKARVVNLHVITQGVDTGTPAGKLLYDLLAAVAEFERELTRERTMAGLLRARDQGKKGGRPPRIKPEERAMLEVMLKDPDIDIKRMLATMKISRSTFYRHFPGGKVPEK